MKFGKCKLCEKKKMLTKHHPIPKAVIKKINPNTSFQNTTIGLCEGCHIALHNHFIEHLVCLGNITEGFNKFDGAKYLILKKYLQNHHKKIYSEWKEFFNKLNENIFKEMDKE